MAVVTNRSVCNMSRDNVGSQNLLRLSSQQNDYIVLTLPATSDKYGSLTRQSMCEYTEIFTEMQEWQIKNVEYHSDISLRPQPFHHDLFHSLTSEVYLLFFFYIFLRFSMLHEHLDNSSVSYMVALYIYVFLSS